jgi:hypothetical protein
MERGVAPSAAPGPRNEGGGAFVAWCFALNLACCYYCSGGRKGLLWLLVVQASKPQAGLCWC